MDDLGDGFRQEFGRFFQAHRISIIRVEQIIGK